MDSDCGRHRDAAAYVLGDLRGQALADYQRHLETCAGCQDEVALLQSAADAVPLLAAAPPKPADGDEDDADEIRPGVWAKERIAMVNAPKLPTLRDLAAPAANAATARPTARPGLLGGVGRLFGLPPWRRTNRGGLRGSPVPGPIMAGVAALAIAAILVIALTKQSQSINYVKGQIAWDNGAAVLKMEGSQGQLLVVGMPTAPSGSSYQVWAIERGVRKEIPLQARLRLNKKGEGGVVIPGDVRTYLALVVYAEPRAGTESPQGTPYVVADLRKLNKKSQEGWP